MARTRATKASPAVSKSKSESTSLSPKYSLSSPNENLSKIFILPTKTSANVRIVTLPNPRHARPARYLVCPDTGIYEFTQISAPKNTPRSWLIESNNQLAEEKTEADKDELKAQISMGAELYLATAIDPLFVLLPALSDSKAIKGADEQKRLFLTSDDHFDKLPEDASHLSEILRCEKTRRRLEARMEAICDTVDAGDETMFRLNEKKLLDVMLDKAKRLSENGLPPSMEEKFVKRALEAPILVQHRDNTIGKPAQPDSKEGSNASTPGADSTESQTTTASAETTSSADSQPSTAATAFSDEGPSTDQIVKAMEASPEMIKLQCLRVAFSFICSNYIAPALTIQLQAMLADPELSSVDFSSLDEYLSKLAKLRAEALASRSVDHYSRKHGRDEEEDEARAEKKRKMEEEKRRKANESRGVKNLKKVDTKGMKKMSDFFKKK